MDRMDRMNRMDGMDGMGIIEYFDSIFTLYDFNDIIFYFL